MRITEEASRKMSPEETLNALKNLAENLDKGDVSIHDFTASIRALISESLSLYPQHLEENEALKNLEDETRDLYSVFHLVACAIDVARQRDALEKIDDLLIYPMSHSVGGGGDIVLLGHASNALTWVLEYMKERGICHEPLGRYELEKVI